MVKEQEKARKAEEKRVRDQEKRKSRGGPNLAALAAAIGGGEKEKERGGEPPVTTVEKPSEAKDEKRDETEDSISLERRRAEAYYMDTPAAPPEAGQSQSTTEPVPVTVTNIPPPSTTQATVAGGQDSETFPKDKEQGRMSWLKSKFARRTSKSIKPEDTPVRSAKVPERSPSVKPEEMTSNTVTEPVTGLPIDPSKAEPGFGTDDIPHMLAAESTETEQPRKTVTGRSSFSSDTVPATAVGKGSNQYNSPVSPVEAEATAVKERFADPSAPGPVTTYPISSPLNPTMDPNSSERDVALAGREVTLARSRSTSISSLSSDEPTTTKTGLEAGEGARGREEAARKESNVTQGSSAGGEEFEEARDRFDVEQLPAPSFPNKSRVESPARETRFKEEL